MSFSSVKHAFVFYTCQVNFHTRICFTLTPLNGRRCWSTVRCLIRSIYPLISFSLYPDLIYPSLETYSISVAKNFLCSLQCQHCMTWTRLQVVRPNPISLTNGQLWQHLQSHKLMWFLWKLPVRHVKALRSPHNLHNLAKWNLDQSSWNLVNSFSSVALTICDIFIVEILVTWPANDR